MAGLAILLENHTYSKCIFFRPRAPGRCLEGSGMSSLPGNHDQQENIPGIDWPFLNTHSN
jgi:hypothetical protein